jgi:hypothetical protein
MPECSNHDTHPCLNTESIRKIIDGTSTDKEKADLIFHYIFHSRCDECTKKIHKSIELFREQMLKTLQNVSYSDQNQILDPKEEQIKSLCRQIGVTYPRP